jgi:hypothetical protein
MATPTALPLSFTAGQVLTAADTNLLRGAFRILQVVHATTSTATSSATSTFVDTTLTATITPRYNNSKIFIMINHVGCFRSSANAFTMMTLQLLRGATVIQTIGSGLGYTGTALEQNFSAGATCLDSPGTISALTYKTQLCSPFSQPTATVQYNGQTSTITLMEVST